MENFGSNRLPILAGEIKTALANVRQHHAATVASASEAGTALLEAKDLVGHGQWLPWLKEHCELSVRSAQAYMRLAKSKSAASAHLTIDAALEAVAKEANPYAGMKEWEIMAEVRAVGRELLAETEARLAVATDMEELAAIAEICKRVIEGEVEVIMRAQRGLGLLA